MISRPDLKTLLLGILLDASSFSIHFLGEKSLKRRTARNLFNKKKIKQLFQGLQCVVSTDDVAQHLT
jgi:hypothetical protein